MVSAHCSLQELFPLPNGRGIFLRVVPSLPVLRGGYRLPACYHAFTHWNGAGTRTMKICSCLPLHGVVGKFGLFRFANMTALLDHHARGVGPDQAQGCRDWTEYTWRGDQAPGQPFVHGLQASDCDMSDLRYSKLTIHIGKNLVENKMPESHWFIETMERGGKIVVIGPDYAAPSAKADYWIGVRPGLSDLAVILGVAKILVDHDWIDEPFVRQFTDLPLLVRTDTLRRLRPEEVIPGYRPKDLTAGPSFKIQAMTDEQREKIGDFTVWDLKERKADAVWPEVSTVTVTSSVPPSGRRAELIVTSCSEEATPAVVYSNVPLSSLVP